MKNLVDNISRDEEEGDVSAFLKDIESFRNSRKAWLKGLRLSLL